MRFAKVDDEVAFKALDRIADAIDDDDLLKMADMPIDPTQQFDPRPANLAKLTLVLDVLGGDDGVFTHIATKFDALDFT